MSLNYTLKFKNFNVSMRTDGQGLTDYVVKLQQSVQGNDTESILFLLDNFYQLELIRESFESVSDPSYLVLDQNSSFWEVITALANNTIFVFLLCYFLSLIHI